MELRFRTCELHSGSTWNERSQPCWLLPSIRQAISTYNLGRSNRKNLGLYHQVIDRHIRRAYQQCVLRLLPPWTTYHHLWIRGRHCEDMACKHVPIRAVIDIRVRASLVRELPTRQTRYCRWFWWWCRGGEDGQRGASSIDGQFRQIDMGTA